MLSFISDSVRVSRPGRCTAHCLSYAVDWWCAGAKYCLLMSIERITNDNKNSPCINISATCAQRGVRCAEPPVHGFWSAKRWISSQRLSHITDESGHYSGSDLGEGSMPQAAHRQTASHHTVPILFLANDIHALGLELIPVYRQSAHRWLLSHSRR